MTKQDFLRLGLALNEADTDIDDEIREEISGLSTQDDEAAQFLQEALVRRTNPRYVQFLTTNELVETCRLWNTLKRPKSKDAQTVRDSLICFLCDESDEPNPESLAPNVQKYLEALQKHIDNSEPFPLALAHLRIHEATAHYLKKSAIHGKWTPHEIVSTKWKRL